MRRLVALLIAPTLLLAACDGSDKTSAPDAPPTTVGCPTVPGVAPPTKTGTGKGAVSLRSVTFDTDDCSDRVTFRFTSKKGVVPSCEISFTNPPFIGARSGTEVIVEGIVYKQLRCEPASGYDIETGAPTYTGPKSLAPIRAQRVMGINQIGDLEGVLTWILGTGNRRRLDPNGHGPEEPLEFRLDTSVEGTEATLVITVW